MGSPGRLAAKLGARSPRRVQCAADWRQFLSPKTAAGDRQANVSENRLSPFNIDTPNRLKILENGLPSDRRTIIGSGGFGKVYKASYKGDQVAAKIMETKQCSSAINSERHASLLRHSNIVKILTIEQGPALSLVAMELCETTLQDRLEETPLKKRERVTILRGVARALQFCHSAGVVHADVKPKNVLIDKNGQPKLTDFGSSVLMAEPDLATKTHGTPGYAAPEVLRGNLATPTADVYSLGIVAWQMLSRKVPFAGLHAHTVIYLSAKGCRPPDDDVDDEFKGQYKALYRKMWSQRVADRPTIGEITEKLSTLSDQ